MRMTDIEDCKLHSNSLKVMLQISHELKVGAGHVRRVQVCQMRNAVPPSRTE
jgi:hypothetical protein